MKVQIYSPKNKIVDDVEAISAYLPGISGDMQILNNHIPIVTTLGKGRIVIELENGNKIEVDISHGYAQFADNHLTVIIEKTDLSVEELIEIEGRAERLKDTNIRTDDIDEQHFSGRFQSEKHA